MRRFLEETNRETQRLRAASRGDERVRRDRDQGSRRPSSGGLCPTMPKELKEQERQLAEVEPRIADREARAAMRPALMSPAHVIAALHIEGFYARRKAYRRSSIGSTSRAFGGREAAWSITGSRPLSRTGPQGSRGCLSLLPSVVLTKGNANESCQVQHGNR